MPIEVWIAIGALTLNVVALLFVTYQTYLSRKALGVANETIESAQRTRALEILPRANWIIEVNYLLNRWRNDLDHVAESLTTALKAGDNTVIKQIAADGNRPSKGLVPTILYDDGPDWLIALLMAGVQYYYNTKSPTALFWDRKRNEPNHALVEPWIERYKDAVDELETLLGYIEDMVPATYLNSPARLNDEAFLER